jgi:hypothetical protein
MRTGRPVDSKLINWDTIPLGSKPDKELAKDLGVSPPSVRQQRVKRKIPAFKLERWDRSLLGVLPDSEISRRYGICTSSISEVRNRLKIPPAKYIPSKQPLYERTCIICGGKVSRPKKFRCPINRTTCGIDCRNKLIASTRTNWEGITGERSGKWKGGMMLSWGYVYILMPEHHRATKNGYVKRATITLEEKLGRLLLPDEIAHHKDRKRDNDSPENLECMTVLEHNRLHAKEGRKKLHEIRIAL